MFLALFDKKMYFCLLDLEIDLLTLKTNTMGQYWAKGTSKFVYEAPYGLQKYKLKIYIFRVDPHSCPRPLLVPSFTFDLEIGLLTLNY